MGNRPTKSHDPNQTLFRNRSFSIQTPNRKRSSRRSFNDSNICVATEQGKDTGSQLSLIRIGNIGRSSSRGVRASGLPSQPSIRLQNSFSSQSSDTNNSATDTGLYSMSSNDSLSQSEYTTGARVSRRNSRRISWRF
jgi:hypothetical protein